MTAVRPQPDSLPETERAPPRDALTGAFQRSVLEERLPLALESARAAGRPAALAMVDLDHFKSVNDAFGHARGDEVLREAGARIRSVLPETAEVFRYGGDEFVILLQADREGAASAAQSVLDALCLNLVAGTPPLSLSASIGVAVFPDDAGDRDALFEQADARAYEAKRQGRGRVVTAAVDESHTGVDERLVERDAALETLIGFLRDLPRSRTGVLTVQGAPGSGRSRFAREAQYRATLMGFQVVLLAPHPAMRSRAYGALLDAREELGPMLALDADALASAAGAHFGAGGVVFVIDEPAFLDPDTIGFVQRLFRSGCDLPVGIIGIGEGEGWANTLSEAPRLRVGSWLSPLSAEGLRVWLRSMLHAEPNDAVVSLLWRSTGGYPGLAASAVDLLRAGGMLAGPSQAGAGAEFPSTAELTSRVRERRLRPLLRTALPSSPLVGRNYEVRELKRMLWERRLITLRGPGGMGKTRLAWQVAAESADRFSDGAVLVPLEGVDSAEHVTSAISDALNLKFAAGNDPAGQLLDYLRTKQLLLVLDNYEHVIGAAELVSHVLSAAPGVRVLATSRERLALREETIYALEALPLPDMDDAATALQYASVQLMLRCARAHVLDYEPSAPDVPHLVRVCRLVGGLPLGIELAGALLRLLPAEELARELNRTPDVLESQARDLPQRHRSLRAVFEYSWALLSDGERDVMAALSVFQGGFSREAAERVAGARLPILGGLVDKSLVRSRDRGGYEVHEIFRRYAAEKLRARSERERDVRTLHAREMSRLLRRGTVPATEVANIRAALLWLARTGDPADLEPILELLPTYYHLRGRFAEAAQTFARAARVARDRVLAARLQAMGGVALAHLSGGSEARARLVRALRVLRHEGSDRDVGTCYLGLGWVDQRRGDYRRARRYFRRALLRFRRAADDAGIARCLNDLGATEHIEGNHVRARRLLLRSLAIRRSLRDPSAVARTANNLASVAHALGASGRTEAYLREALAQARAADDQPLIFSALHNLAVFQQSQLRDDPTRLGEARALLEEAYELCRELGLRAALPHALSTLAEMEHAAGANEQARRRYADALELAWEGRAIPLVLSIFTAVGELLVHEGELERALPLLVIAQQHDATSREISLRAAEARKRALVRLDKRAADRLTRRAERALIEEITSTLIADLRQTRAGAPAVDAMAPLPLPDRA